MKRRTARSLPETSGSGSSVIFPATYLSVVELNLACIVIQKHTRPINLASVPAILTGRGLHPVDLVPVCSLWASVPRRDFSRAGCSNWGKTLHSGQRRMFILTFYIFTYCQKKKSRTQIRSVPQGTHNIKLPPMSQKCSSEAISVPKIRLKGTGQTLDK